ncbi:MAG TPA: BglII/BstYI family type II restriction endonuclease [Virgibacillus sp.]|nr:BglII/BstYI family type II restriction endonuclease [Virgibacillus sp.]HLR68860.1 BglII/BstYI family type II restriction endonuclease [Virgibacillus sp.]
MNYDIYSHRYAVSILETEYEFAEIWAEVKHIINKISEQMIIERFEEKHFNQKSISRTINELLKEEFVAFGWEDESYIFQDTEFRGDTWRLDFAKENISMEVAFNHGSVVAWNLLKPVLASELNHVKKAIQTKMGIVICATQALKSAGGFDSAVGSYEKYLSHFAPLNNQLSVPIALIGLEAPKSFYIKHIKKNGKNKGVIKYI